MITPTGENLKIVISCQNKPEHNWMSYVSWYSILKNLPDATVMVAIDSGDPRLYFKWIKKTNTGFFRFKKNLDNLIELPYLVISPNVMCIRTLDENILKILNKNHRLAIGDKIKYITESKNEEYLNSEIYCADVRSSEPSSFVFYTDFTDFVLNDWIEKNACPLTYAKSFRAMTVNADKLLKLWINSSKTFSIF